MSIVAQGAARACSKAYKITHDEIYDLYIYIYIYISTNKYQ